VYLPELVPGVKTGLDDFLKAGGTVADLWRYAEDQLRPVPAPKPARPTLPTAALLEAVENALGTYVRFPDEHGRTAATLWTLHTWAVDASDCTPYLYVKSPQKRSGKTRLLETLELVCRGALRATSVTESALFQVVSKQKPCLLIDEVDALFTARSERAELLRGVLNAGNRRGSVAIRGGQDGEPMEFETFCPKCLAGIDTGKLPDTIRDRAIVIPLERKRREEQVERVRVRDIGPRVEELRARLEEWSAYHVEQLEQVRPAPILEISDRLDEAWEPLIAIAELAQAGWPERARAAAVALDGEDTGSEDHGALLLAALQDLFAERESIPTADICKALNEDDDLPFGAYRRGEGIDGRGLGKMLRPYRIRSKNLKLDGKVPKGYTRDQFAEAWERYAQDASEEPLPALLRYQGSENGSTEPKTEVADTGAPSATDPLPPEVADTGPASATDPLPPDSALQSQNGDAGSGVAEVADQVWDIPRGPFDAEGRTPLGQELERRALEGADDDASRFVRGESNELGTPAEWTEEETERFLARARDVFPGSLELYPRRFPPPEVAVAPPPGERPGKDDPYHPGTPAARPPRPGSCVCRHPARSPRVDGPVCMNCRHPSGEAS
jgi:hypothetical protein